MSENTPNVPSGAMPPKPAEAAKIQPKKETVRINLPPKPTSAPTIKLPTLPAGGPPPPTLGAAAPAPISVPAAPPRAAAAPVATAARVTAAPAAATTAQRPAAPSGAVAAPASRPVAAVAVVSVSGLDKGLAIAAAVIGLLSLGCVLYLMLFLKDTAAAS